MPAHYIEIDSGKFAAFLESKGFSRSIVRDEVVYVRPHSKEQDLKTYVYTSSRVGDAAARNVGKDAIRVIVLFEKNGKTYPIFKGTRIHRTTSFESVCERVMDRLDAAEARCFQWLEEQDRKRHAPLAKVNPELRSAYVGQLREQVRITVEVTARKPWSDKFLFTMKDADGNTFIYWTEKDLLQVGRSYDLSATIKGYGTFAGVRQTEITDVRGKAVMR